jgi:hypothetical protein
MEFSDEDTSCIDAGGIPDPFLLGRIDESLIR